MPTSASFTKLVVDDLEKMVAFYGEAYGLFAVHRFRGHIGAEPIEEIQLSPDPKARFGSFILIKFLERPASPQGELILGFTTDDLPALLERVRRAGGRIHSELKEMPELHIRVAFATDPEGHLAELVQVLA
jgi:predicted enzyme related to lactoylglutathione lyase